MSPRGRFIVLEGGEASGKSTQAATLADALGAVLTREPGGTAAGEHIRNLLLDPSLSAVAPRAEALLMLAARAQHVAEVIRPALDAGRDVVCDRFSASTVAYQGYGRGLDPSELARLSDWAAGEVTPDRVIWLRVTAEEARARLARRGGADRMEAETVTFFRRVEEGYAVLAAADPGRWRVVDGSGPVDEVAVRVLAASAS
ncbi:MAG: dTMP kinase [Acidimicrobiales bacterium]|nr:dTMP kinase [Acidimicrobiales bacterium]